MKNIYTLAALLLTIHLQAQISFEHEYKHETLKRIKLESSGEKYYFFENRSQVVLFNADHSYWKTIVLPKPSTASVTIFRNISEKQFNSDTLIELNYTYSYRDMDNNDIFTSRIINENGEILFDALGAYEIRLNQITGLADKLFVFEDKDNPRISVYNVTNFELLHTYTSGQDIDRIVLENSGEKYYTIDYNTSKISLYNADHTNWKEISLELPSNTNLSWVGLVSDKKLNEDNEIEVAYSYMTQSSNLFSYDGRIINESGLIINTIPKVTFFSLDERSGLTPKLLTYYGMSTTSFKVISIDGLSIEQDYSGINYFERILLRAYGEKYYVFDKQNKQIKLFNPDHTIWKIIDLPMPSGAEAAYTTHVSDYVINTDNLIEVVYTYSETVNGNLQNTSKIINEKGQTLLTESGSTQISISQILGLQPKAITFVKGSESITRVYNIEGSVKTGLSEKRINNTVSVYPNPAISIIKIKTDDQVNINRAELYNLQGKQILSKVLSSSVEIDMYDVQKGVYIIKLYSDDNQVYSGKLVFLE
jgi:hypothetical protein